MIWPPTRPIKSQPSDFIRLEPGILEPRIGNNDGVAMSRQQALQGLKEAYMNPLSPRISLKVNLFI